MPEIPDEFETTDIYLAAYLKIAGCEYLRRRRQGARLFFVFTNPAGSVREIREAFYSGRGKVGAHQYSHEIKSFKELCHDP